MLRLARACLAGSGGCFQRDAQKSDSKRSHEVLKRMTQAPMQVRSALQHLLSSVLVQAPDRTLWLLAGLEAAASDPAQEPSERDIARQQAARAVVENAKDTMRQRGAVKARAFEAELKAHFEVCRGLRVRWAPSHSSCFVMVQADGFSGAG